MQQLFREMNTGTGKGISVVLRKKLLHFNGGLFADDTVLPINGLQLGLLKEAARQNWGNVEPAIFGTLLERALNPGRAPPAWRALHAARLCRAPGFADRH